MSKPDLERELEHALRRLGELTQQNANQRRLLADLRHARPLMLYGMEWIADIENVLAGHRYESLFPDAGPPR